MLKQVSTKTILKQVNTKMFGEGDVVSTTLTLDFLDLTEAEILEIAAGAAVIKWQSKVRNRKEAIPETDTYIVPRPGARAIAAPMTTEALLAEVEKRGEVNKVIKYAEKYLADIKAATGDV